MPERPPGKDQTRIARDTVNGVRSLRVRHGDSRDRNGHYVVGPGSALPLQFEATCQKPLAGLTHVTVFRAICSTSRFEIPDGVSTRTPTGPKEVLVAVVSCAVTDKPSPEGLTSVAEGPIWSNRTAVAPFRRIPDTCQFGTTWPRFTDDGDSTAIVGEFTTARKHCPALDIATR